MILCCIAHWINSLFIVPVSGAKLSDTRLKRETRNVLYWVCQNYFLARVKLKCSCLWLYYVTEVTYIYIYIYIYIFASSHHLDFILKCMEAFPIQRTQQSYLLSHTNKCTNYIIYYLKSVLVIDIKHFHTFIAPTCFDISHVILREHSCS
jgi:hypothetical protein